MRAASHPWKQTLTLSGCTAAVCLVFEFDLEIVVVNFTLSGALISPSTIFGFI